MADIQPLNMDPWEWSLDHMVKFFCRDLISTTHTSRSLGKPALEIFKAASKDLEKTLRDHEVNGQTLLMFGNPQFLKDKLGITNFGLRRAIFHQVSCLRARSKLYQRHLLGMPGATQMSRSQTPPHSGSASESDDGITDNFTDLTLVPHESKPLAAVSNKGRKRRRILPTQIITGTSTQTPSTTNYFLSQKKVSLLSIYCASNPDDSDQEDNFQILNFKQTPKAATGFRQFVKNRLQYLFNAPLLRLSASQSMVTVHSEYLSNEAPLAILYSNDTRRSTSLVDAVTLQRRTSEDRNTPEQDWGFLDHWIRQDQEEEQAGVEPSVYPAYLESGDEDDYEESLLDEYDEEQDERMKRTSKILPADAVREIVDDELNIKSESWKRKSLPKLEAKAYQVWEKACNRGRLGRHVLQRATKEIADLETRLLKLRRSIEGEIWRKDIEVRRMCQTLEVSLYRKLELEWKTKLWRGPQPTHSIELSVKPRRGSKRTTAGSDVDSEDVGSESDGVTDDADFILPDKDPLVRAFRRSVQSNEPNMQLQSNMNARKTMHGCLSDDSDHHPEIVAFASPQKDVEMIDLTLMDSDDRPQVNYSQERPTPVVRAEVSSDAHSNEYSQDNPYTKKYLEKKSFTHLIKYDTPEAFIYKVLLNETSASITQAVWFRVCDSTLTQLQTDINSGLEQVTQGDTIPRGNKVYSNMTICLGRLWVYWTCLSMDHEAGKPRLTPNPDDIDVAKELLIEHEAIDSVGGLNDFLTAIRQYRWVQPEESFSEGDHILGDTESLQNRKLKRKATRASLQVNARQKKALKRQMQADQLTQAHNKSLGSYSSSQCGVGEIINLFRQDEANDPFIRINPQISSKLKSHQLDGIRFLWREITQTSSVDDDGCLLSHTMGLGKTLQVIAFLVTVMDVRQSADLAVRKQLPKRLQSGLLRILVLCPAAIIDNWKEELNKWVPDQETSFGRIFSISASTDSAWQRIQTLKTWYTSGGVLILGYHLFRGLVAHVSADSLGQTSLDITDSTRRMLFEGPSIVVADEAQYFKNPLTGLGRVIGGFTTKSRIAMTGSPLSNNCQEYYTMIDWVSPGYLGTYEQFKCRYQLPIENGFYSDSTPVERRKALTRLKALNDDITPKVHRKDISAMQGSLKPKIEFVMTLSLTEAQKEMYNDFIRFHQDKENKKWFLTWSHDLERLLSHPAVFLDKLKGNRYCGDNMPASGPLATVDDVEAAERSPDDSMSDMELTIPHTEKDAYSQLVKNFLATANNRYGKEKQEYFSSTKLQVLRTILVGSAAQNDKVLIFCTLIPVLDFLESFVFSLGMKVLKFDGNTKASNRQALTKSFNTDDTQVFLISTKAGGVGLNIPGANRVVIFSFGFNPTDEDQAVGRAYRLGQTKPVYVYHFVTGGTFEEVVFHRALFKRQLQIRVVDKGKPTSAAEKNRSGIDLTPVQDVARRDLSEFLGKDIIMDEIINTSENLLQLKTTEVLNKEIDEPLDEEELREVQSCIDENRLRRSSRLASQGVQSSPSRNAALAAHRARNYHWLK